VRIVALEEHFATASLLEGPALEFLERFSSATAQVFPGAAPRRVEQLFDLAEGRIALAPAATRPFLREIPRDPRP